MERTITSCLPRHVSKELDQRQNSLNLDWHSLVWSVSITILSYHDAGPSVWTLKNCQGVRKCDTAY